jgi:hypothetical protein
MTPTGLQPDGVKNASDTTYDQSPIEGAAYSGAVDAADPLLAWLDACPGRLSDGKRIKILSIARSFGLEGNA